MHVHGNLDIIYYRHFLKQPDILERTGNTGHDNLMCLLAVHLLATQIEGAFCGLINTGQQVKDCSLTGTVRTNQSHQLALTNLHTEGIHCLQSSKGNAKILCF